MKYFFLIIVYNNKLIILRIDLKKINKKYRDFYIFYFKKIVFLGLC